MNGTQIRIAQIIELVESLKMKKIYPKIQPIFFSSYNRSNSLKNMNQQESFHDVNNGILVFTFSIIWKPICCSGFIFLFAVFLLFDIIIVTLLWRLRFGRRNQSFVWINNRMSYNRVSYNRMKMQTWEWFIWDGWNAS